MKRAPAFLTWFFIIVLGQGISAQSVDTQVLFVPITIVEVRQFDTTSLYQYKSQDAFIYGTVVQSKESLWSKLKRWFWNKLGDFIGPEASLWSKIIFYGLLVFGLIGIILYFARVETSTIFRKGDYRRKLNAEILDQQIDSVNIVELIEASKKDGNFKLAIRYLLIQTLIQLELENVIELNQNTTIAQYRKTFPIKALQSKFADLTKIFEYTWYGEYTMDRKQYGIFEDQFASFLKSIQSI